MIELKGFSKTYPHAKEESVHSADLQCSKGITGLIGLNGAGKTTILKAISGLHYQTSGEVKVSGPEGTFYSVPDEISKALSVTGFVSETPVLPLGLTVKEFLKSVERLYKINPEKSLYEKVMKDWDLFSVENRKIKELSKGFKQRLSFAQAFIHDPENIILDEPVNGLDPAQILQFRKNLKKAGESKTILISTHLMQEVHSLCDRIYVINQGRIIFSGTEAEIIEKSGGKNIEDAFMILTGKTDE